MSELKDSRESLLRENEISTKAIIYIITAELKGLKEQQQREKGQ
jgi:hypothetical protein